MFEIVVGLIEGYTCKELDENTAEGVGVARIRPAETENDLWSTVVTSGYYCGMVFMLESGRTKVDQSNFC